ncbi:MAG: hypothetical protein ACLTXS_22725 [[Clostridium] symbiosum]
MTVRFMKGTSIAELEREMQQVPGFGPRKSGVIRSRQAGETARGESCRYVNVWRAEKEQGMDGQLYAAANGEMLPAFYQILLRLLAEELPGSALTVRVGKLQEEGETRVMFFKSEKHRRRFRALMRCGLYPGLVTEPGFAVAVFLLSSEEKLWEKAGPFVQERTIDYSRFRLHGADLDSYATFCVAKELCTGKPYVSLSELGDPELFHDGLLHLIIHAVLISRHGIGAVLNEEEVEC